MTQKNQSNSLMWLICFFAFASLAINIWDSVKIKELEDKITKVEVESLQRDYNNLEIIETRKQIDSILVELWIKKNDTK